MPGILSVGIHPETIALRNQRQYMFLKLILTLFAAYASSSSADDEAKHAPARGAARILLGGIPVSVFFVFQDPLRGSELKLCILRLKEWRESAANEPLGIEP